MRVKWKGCSTIAKYKFHDGHNSQVPLLNKLLNDKDITNLDILIMSGTNDSICGTQETQRWVETLDIKPKTKWKQYFVDKQPSGYISTYKGTKNKTFTLATVNGAGHEIPMYKPVPAFYLMKRFIEK